MLNVANRDAGPRVHIDLRDATLRMALSFAVDEAGWTRAARREPGTALVADWLVHHPATPPLDVLVIPSTPAAARRAVDAFTAGAVRSVLRANEPGALPGVLDLVQRDLGVVPAAVVEAARAFPPLTLRLERTLRLVLCGWSNKAIAAYVHQSEATTKRDVTELLRRFDAPNRMALASTALRLGVHPEGRR